MQIWSLACSGFQALTIDSSDHPYDLPSDSRSIVDHIVLDWYEWDTLEIVLGLSAGHQSFNNLAIDWYKADGLSNPRYEVGVWSRWL